MWGDNSSEAIGVPCCVCGEGLPALHHTYCEGCAGAFHLRMTENTEAKDCGVVFMDDERCTTVSLCTPCYARGNGS